MSVGPSKGKEARSVHIALIVVPSLKQRIAEHASREDRSQSWIMHKALELGMTELEARANDKNTYPGS
jgi:predicted transcriptional regulator